MMDVKEASYCTLVDQRSQSKYVCYTSRTDGGFSIRLTDAAAVWSSEFTEETLKQFRQTFALKSTEDYVLKLRSACGRGEVSVVEHETSIELHAGSGPGDPSVTLSRLDGPQATAEVKELLFRMAHSLAQPTGGGAPSVSPAKGHQRRPAEFEPRQQHNGASLVTVKKRLAGASLINPGAKRKQRATGVAFDDAEEA